MNDILVILRQLRWNDRLASGFVSSGTVTMFLNYMRYLVTWQLAGYENDVVSNLFN